MLLSRTQLYMAASVKQSVLKVDTLRAADKKENKRRYVQRTEEKVHRGCSLPVRTRSWAALTAKRPRYRRASCALKGQFEVAVGERGDADAQRQQLIHCPGQLLLLFLRWQ